MQQGLVRSLNLSLCIGFVSISAFSLSDILFDTHRKVFLSYGHVILLPMHTQCTYANQDGSPDNFTSNCYEHLSLPAYDSTCDAAFSLNYNNSYACELEVAYMHKFVATSLPQTAPRVHSFMKAMSVSSGDAVSHQPNNSHTPGKRAQFVDMAARNVGWR